MSLGKATDETQGQNPDDRPSGARIAQALRRAPGRTCRSGCDCAVDAAGEIDRSYLQSGQRRGSPEPAIVETGGVEDRAELMNPKAQQIHAANRERMLRERAAML